jgi:GNAT superfamily N-acetyltransferase
VPVYRRHQYHLYNYAVPMLPTTTIEEQGHETTPQLCIRPATLEDAPQLVPLLSQLGYSYSEEEVSKRITLYRQSPFSLMVASYEEQIIGCVAISFIHGVVAEEKRCRIEALIVESAWRRHGLGRLLMNAAQEKAAAAGCTLIELTSGVHRKKTGSHQFYHSLGYINEGAEEKIYLKKKLGIVEE